MCMYCIERSVDISITINQGLTTNTFVMLLLAMISLHMLTFRLMVTMVTDFCSLVIHTLLGEIMISSTRVNKNVRNDIFPHAKIHIH